MNGRLYLRAAASALPGRRPRTLPEIGALRESIMIDRAHLVRYDQICGFARADLLPVTYPHVLAFPLGLALLCRRDFPLPALGLVHIGQTMRQHRPISADERLEFAVHAEHLRDHPRGRAVDLVATASADGEIVWAERSTYLRKERATDGRDVPDSASLPDSAPPPEPAPEPAPPPLTARWRVGTDVATRYAAISGDRNPIHTSALAARAFGFRRRIAHGMWSMARCLSAFAGRLPDAYSVEVAFQRPILLPATVAFGSAQTATGWRFALHDPRSGAPHLRGVVSATPPKITL